MAEKFKSGRRRESAVWNFFQYDAINNKSRCLVTEQDAAAACGKLLCGKNATNLKSHLRKLHRDEFRNFLQAEETAKRHAAPRCSFKSSRSADSSPARPGSSESAGALRVCDGGRSSNSCWDVAPAACDVKNYEKSKETRARLQEHLLVDFIITSASPARLVENREFVKFCESLDSTFRLPRWPELTGLIAARKEQAVHCLRSLLTSARLVTVGLDVLTMKGLPCSFLAISASFFHPPSASPLRVVLGLLRVDQPHSDDAISRLLAGCLQDWGIEQERVLMFVTYCTSRAVKATKEVDDCQEMSDDDSGDDEDDACGCSRSKCDEHTARRHEKNRDNFTTLRGTAPFPCLAHTLLSVLKAFKRHETVSDLLAKTSSLIKAVKNSQAAVQSLRQKCGRALLTCQSARWRENVALMVRRLLEVRKPLADVAEETGIERLSSHDWERLEELCSVLEIFHSHADQLLSDAQPLSTVVPTILNLIYHLQESATKGSTFCNAAVQQLLVELRHHSAALLNPQDVHFNPLAAAACYVNPSPYIGASLLMPELALLREAAQKFILQKIAQVSNRADEARGGKSHGLGLADPFTDRLTPQTRGHAPLPPRYEYLARKLAFEVTAANLDGRLITPDSELQRYNKEVGSHPPVSSPVAFWQERRQAYPTLSRLAEDLISVPVSQTYAERLFPLLCDFLSARGQLGCAGDSLTHRVFLQINESVLDNALAIKTQTTIY